MLPGYLVGMGYRETYSPFTSTHAHTLSHTHMQAMRYRQTYSPYTHTHIHTHTPAYAHTIATLIRTHAQIYTSKHTVE